METRSHYVAVGAFVLVMLAGLFAAALWLAGTQFREHYDHYVTYVTGPVTGLGKNAAVRLNGIEIGRVDDIALDPNDPKQVVLTLAVQKGVVLHQDSIASLTSSGLTGQSYILITGGRTDAPVLTAKDGQIYPVIKSRPSTLQQVEATVPQMLARFSAIADRLDRLMTPDNQQAITETLTNLAATSAVIAVHRDQIGTTLDNAATASAALNKDLAEVQATLAASRDIPAHVDGTLADVDTASRHVAALADHLDQVVGENRADLHAFSATGLTQLTRLAGELRLLVENLTQVTAALERDPSSLVYGDRRQGYTPP